jgi:mannose-6-phosphate isomerase-like protein (cupin superfamily)
MPRPHGRKHEDPRRVHRSAAAAPHLGKHTDAQHGIEIVTNEYEPDTGSGSEATHRTNTEFGTLLSGALTVAVDGKGCRLKPGGCTTCSSASPRRFVNKDKSVACAVRVNLDS